jgi:putative endonuclease
MTTLVARVLGHLGEALAEEYLTAHGAQVLARNYHSSAGEVDLLVLHEGDLVAVEVKTRGSEDPEKPEEAISWWKLKRIVHTLTTYAVEAEMLEHHWRVDLLAIETDAHGGVLRVEHIRDIFPP